MNQPAYEFCQNVLTVLNVALIIVMTSITSSGGVDTFRNWMFIQIFVNLLLLVELVADLIVFGPIKAYSQHFRAWPETVC